MAFIFEQAEEKWETYAYPISRWIVYTLETPSAGPLTRAAASDPGITPAH